MKKQNEGSAAIAEETKGAALSNDPRADQASLGGQTGREISVGRIVDYRLSAEDVDAINRRRTTGESIKTRIFNTTWPVGAQAHIGATVAEGETFPMIVTRLVAANDGDDLDRVNGQVVLDGNDTFWARGVAEDANAATPGTWGWPVRG